MKPSKDMSFKKLRILSVLLFLGFIPMGVAFIWISNLIFKTDGPGIALAAAWGIAWAVTCWGISFMKCQECCARNPYLWGILGRCRRCRTSAG